ncbi:DUF1266 domain-containing protein [Pseudomonas defluvii]|uniref:DUF1266 domain-containing protein n=1 Tax=Pseudomonas defluvii TaxID=1876757 RepID=UPI00081145AA|nr:DUF1266 domain-containing protein [Pseudomonas defluvii]
MEEIEQRWLYALSAPMAALNGSSYTAPDYIEMDLQDGWGISNREQLLEMLYMADRGHASGMLEAYWNWQRCLPSEWSTLLDGLAPRQRALHEFASRTFSECGHGGIRAWDLGRMGFLLRNGLRSGWINLDESLWLHSRLALRARHYYNSWSTYLGGYMTGRMYWCCLDSADDELGHALDREGYAYWSRCSARALAQDAAELFAELPWDLPLTLPQKPDSLAEFNWS